MKRKPIIVVEGTLIRLRLKGKTGVVLGLTFQCPCGRVNRVRVGSIVGQNTEKVQFRCSACKSINNLPKKKEDIEKAIHGQVQD
jgi:hypothetical protein